MPEKDHRDIVIERCEELAKRGDSISNRDFWHVVMDEYFKERALELLGYVAKETDNYVVDEDGVVVFLYKNQWLTREELFENFL